MRGVFSIEATLKRCPAMEVPITVKMPDPMTAPMPSAVSDTGPRDFFSAFSAHSESLMSLSIDVRAKSCDRRDDSGKRSRTSAALGPGDTTLSYLLVLKLSPRLWDTKELTVQAAAPLAPS